MATLNLLNPPLPNDPKIHTNTKGKTKLKTNRELSEGEKLREEMKYEIAKELGISDKIDEFGWGGLTAEETGRIGGIMTRVKKQRNIPNNKEIEGYSEK